MCGGVAHSFCTAVKQLSESKKYRQDCLMSSAQSFYGPCLQSVVQSRTCCFSGNVPLFHTSRYVIPRDSVYPVLILRAINGGARRPGYEATVYPVLSGFQPPNFTQVFLQPSSTCSCLKPHPPINVLAIVTALSRQPLAQTRSKGHCRK